MGKNGENGKKRKVHPTTPADNDQATTVNDDHSTQPSETMSCLDISFAGGFCTPWVTVQSAFFSRIIPVSSPAGLPMATTRGTISTSCSTYSRYLASPGKARDLYKLSKILVRGSDLLSVYPPPNLRELAKA
jgi:hypothetical protein